ncbi:helix-turn-helix domain-containing protein [Labedaea rhizosphaerae]|uniref:Excisionase family DNA binding protein n=1 Tax=Labedaea rhizosphaerae TaxID=598644 RepID=A0A4R6RU78_LABRH|nr:helix-turn-helix domain-containing protein [Labedaea rhizosphaerae]TDP90509.1 excisionase family DNA binding protein [Labedaea rhizosphaerae]
MSTPPAARGVDILARADATVSIPEAARVLGVSRDLAYDLARRGELGVRVLKLGCRWRVPTNDLRRAVGLDPAA